MRVDAKAMARRWGLDVAQARYSDWGNWYGLLANFPAALLDAHGYILFHNAVELSEYREISITKQINIPNRISTLVGYVRVTGLIPEELPQPQLVPAGSSDQVLVNRYERSAKARKACLEHYGYKCVVCQQRMSDIYGHDASSLIHVHHLIPVSEITDSYRLDPIADLRPICPNCHAFVHLYSPPLPVEAAAKKLEEIGRDRI